MKLFNNLKRGIINIIKWFPVIWNDEDYDFQTIYTLLYHKLNHMEQYYESDKTYSANADKTAYEIMIAKNLAKRLAKENYLNNALIEHEQKYPDYLEKSFHTEKIEGKDLYRIMDLNSKEEKKSFERCSQLSDYLEQQDREYLFDYLKKKIRNWWG